MRGLNRQINLSIQQAQGRPLVHSIHNNKRCLALGKTIWPRGLPSPPSAKARHRVFHHPSHHTSYPSQNKDHRMGAIGRPCEPVATTH